MPHRISVKRLIAKVVALRLMWCHWRAGLFYIYCLIYRGPQSRRLDGLYLCVASGTMALNSCGSEA